MSPPTVAKENFASACRVRRRRCKFIGSWLDMSEFAAWLEPLDDDRHKAYCLLCAKVFSVAHGGLHDVRAHWRGKRHIGFEAAIVSDDYHPEDSIDRRPGRAMIHGDDPPERWTRRRSSSSSEKPLPEPPQTTIKVLSRAHSSPIEVLRHDVEKTSAEKCIKSKVQQENELLVRHLDRQARGKAVERRSQNAGNSFWPSGDLEELVEAEDVREIDEFENSDNYFEFENQLERDTDEILGKPEAEGTALLLPEQEEQFERLNSVVVVVDKEKAEEEEEKNNRAWPDESLVVESSRMLREQRSVSGSATTGANTPTMSSMFPQQYCLRWKYHHSNLQTMFSQLLERQAYCDVTLACEGQTLRAHKVVLSACSTYFDTILSQYEEKDPIVIMRDVKFSDIKVLVEFMYKGEINIDHTRLSSLLKTAEDLHIKGLAEVSWRSDSGQNDLSNSGHSPGAATPGVETVLREGDVDEPPPPKQRRRGRPPLDDPPSAHDVFTPKITCFTGNVRTFPEEMMSEGDHESCDDEMMAENNETPLPVLSYLSKDDSASDQEKKASNAASNSNATNPAIPEQFRDVVKMNDYLTTGRRQEFWEEPFTRRVMDAIKSKELEMKTAAEILGVSYGTLYGRYRDSYGCLKHPYRVRDFWSEPGPAEVLAKLRRKEITLFRAAEFLNVTVHTLATYLSTLQGPDRISLAGELSGATSAMDGNNDMENNETVNEILQKLNANAATAATPTTSATIKREGGGYIELPTLVPKAASSVLENNPDITIVKTESVLQQQQRKRDYAKVSNTENNNAKLMSGGAVSEISQQQQLKISDTLSLNNDNSKP